jgi:hypothetical protein
MDHLRRLQEVQTARSSRLRVRAKTAEWAEDIADALT